MPIAVVYRPPAMTADQYRASWEGGVPVSPPPGLIFHAGVGEGDDFATMTVWESREAYEAFAPTFTRVMAEKGFRLGPPQIMFVHHMLMPTGGQ